MACETIRSVARDRRPIQSRGQQRPGASRAWSRCQTLPLRNFQETALQRQLTQHSQPTRRGHRLVFETSGTASGGSPLGKCATVRVLPSGLLRWRIVHPDPSIAAAAAPKEVCLHGLTPPYPFLTTSPSHLPMMLACHSLASDGLLAVVEGSQCVVAAKINRTAHDVKCARGLGRLRLRLLFSEAASVLYCGGAGNPLSAVKATKK